MLGCHKMHFKKLVFKRKKSRETMHKPRYKSECKDTAKFCNAVGFVKSEGLDSGQEHL